MALWATDGILAFGPARKPAGISHDGIGGRQSLGAAETRFPHPENRGRGRPRHIVTFVSRTISK
jgi:hypothetical protein